MLQQPTLNARSILLSKMVNFKSIMKKNVKNRLKQYCGVVAVLTLTPCCVVLLTDRKSDTMKATRYVLIFTVVSK